LELAMVWHELCPLFPDAHLIIIGSGRGLMHDCEDELKALVDAHGLSASVTLTGFVDNVEAYLQAGDIFAFPTTDEAFGIALIEAMACGLAAVASRHGGIKDILADATNGLLIEPGDPVTLKAGLVRLLEDDDLRHRLGAAAIRTVEERYTTKAVVGRYVELLQELQDIKNRSVATLQGRRSEPCPPEQP
jgi:glycosyltransferase involved in cell wall biosynthesis